MKFLTVFSIIAVSFFFFVSTIAAQTFPKPQGYVNDYAQLYSQEFKTRLEGELATLAASSSAELSIVTVTDIQGSDIDDYAVRLFESWKIGKKGKDNGVLLLIVRNERAVRIEVGYGLEGVITDARAGRIIRDQIVPAFRENDYEKGTQAAVTTLTKYIRGETVLEEPKSDNDSQDWSWIGEVVPFLFFGVIYLGSFLARSKSFFAGGIIGIIVGVIIGAIVGGVIAIFGIAVIAGFIGLLLDFVLSRNYQHLKEQHKSTDWWGSRGGFYGGGGGGSSGGFGGFGGGMSGGGGASGRW